MTEGWNNTLIIYMKFNIIKTYNILDDKIKKQNLDINNILVIEVNPEDDIPQELSGLAAMNIVTKYNKPCLVVRRNSEGML